MADAISAVRDLIESNWTKPPKPSIEDIAVLDRGDAKRVRMLDNDVIRIFETAHNEAQPELLYDYVNRHVNITLDVRTVKSRERLSELRTEVRRILHAFRKGDGVNFDRLIFKTRTDLSDRSKKLFRYTIQAEVVTFALVAGTDDTVVNPFTGVVSASTTYQTYDTGLTEIANLTPTNGYVIIGDGSSWTTSAVAGDITAVTAGTGLSGGGVTGDVTLNVSGLTVSELAAGSLQISSEAFADNDTTLMTSAAIQDKILSYGYTTAVGDITAVTAGSGLTGGGSSGDLTVTLDLKDEDNMASNSATHAASQQSIKAYVDAEVAGLVDSAPAALNTLNELAASLNDDANFSTTISTALGLRVRVDTNGQSLTNTQKANARTNIAVDVAGTDNSTNVTLAGSRDYLTISGQEITRGVIDISDDTNLAVSAPITLSGDTIGLADPANLSQLTESSDATDDKILLWDESASSWKYMTVDDLQDSIDTSTLAANDATITLTAGTGLSGGGDFTTNQSGNETLTFNVGGLTIAELAAGAILLSSESFVDSDTQLMTAKAIADKIESYGYTTQVGDITGVTAGAGLSGGGNSGALTLNLSHLGIESLSDPNDDRILFWDDSAGATAFLDIGSNLTITGTTIAATDTNTTYSAGTGLTLSGTTFSVSDPANLDELTESDDNPSDKILLWDESASVWKHMTIDNLGDALDVSTTLNALTDVTISNPAAGHVLVYDNTNSIFENTPLTAGSNISITNADGSITLASTDTNTQLSTEQVQDIVGAMFSSNTETRISATYEDGDGTIDLVVDDMTTNTQLSTEQVQDIVGAMFSSNTETRVSATYEDGDGTIDLVVDDMTANTNQLTTFVIRDDDDDSKTVAHNKYLKFASATGAAGTNWSGSGTTGDPWIMTITNPDTTYSVGDGGLTQNNFTNTLKTKLDGIEVSADVTDKANVGSALASLDGTDTLYIGDAGNDATIRVRGNFYVDGTTTSVNQTEVNVQNAFVFEGATSDNYETTLTITDPTADRTITLPNASGTISLSDTQLSTEQVQDIVGAMFASNTETRISATYEDGDGTIDLVVDDMTANTQLSTEQVQDIVGAMFSGNTETNTAVTYDDSDGTIDVVTTLDGGPLSTEAIQDIVGAMFSSNTETSITATYQDSDGTIDLVVLPGSDQGVVVNTGGALNTTSYMHLAFGGSSSGDPRGIALGHTTGGNNFPGWVTTYNDNNLLLDTNKGTNTGKIEIFEGSNNNIAITPHGTGKIILDGLSWPNADGTANYVLQTNGSGALSWAAQTSNTWRTVTVAGNASLTDSEALTFNAGSNVSITEQNGSVTIASTDTNTTYSAGNGLTLSGTTFTLADPATGTTIDESTADPADRLPIWDESASSWKYITIDDLQDEIDTASGGTVTEVTVGGGLDISNGTSTPSITLDFAELSASGTLVGTDDLVVIDDAATRKTQIDTIPLSIFSNDAGWTSNTGDITGVTAGAGLSGGGASGSVTLSLDDPANLSQLTESTDATDDKILLWDEDAGSWKYMTLDDLQDSIDTTASGGAGEAFKTISVSGQDDVVADGATDTLTLAGGSNVTITTTAGSDTITFASADTNTQLTDEYVQDLVGAMFSSNTETNTTVTYQDGDGTIDVVTTLDGAPLTTEAVQDIVGAMFSSNTETRVAVTYQDGDGTIDVVVDDMTANDNTWRTVTAGGNTLSTSETLAFTAGSNVTITESGGAVTIASTDTDTNTWRTVTAGGNTLSTSETLAFTAGSNVSITESGGAVTIASTDTNTTYSVGDGGLTEYNFTSTLRSKLLGVESDADITDKANVSAALASLTGDDTLYIGDSGDDTTVRVRGNFYVDGTTTSVNQTEVNVQNAFVFEGATADAYETTLTITDPTADRTITLPNASGTVSLSDTQLSTEQVQDIVGAMFSSNTETRISATYEDGDGTIDLVVDDMTANDNTWRTVTAGGNTLSTSETLAFTAGSNVTITESGGAVTIASADTNTQLSTEAVQDIVGAMFSSNTETRVAVTYQDGDGTIDLVVDDMTANDNTWRTVTAGGNTLSTSETLAFTAGSNVTITESGGAVTIAATGDVTTTATQTLTNKTYGPLSSGYVVMGASNDTLAITSNGAHNLHLSTNSNSNSGSILIQQGANQPISITPNGSGDVILDGLKWPQADGTANYVLKTDGNAQLSWVAQTSDTNTTYSGGTGLTLSSTTFNVDAAQTQITSIGTIGTGVWQGTAIAQAYIADQAINEAKLQVSNSPTNGYVLTAQSGNTGGLTWAAASSGGASALDGLSDAKSEGTDFSGSLLIGHQTHGTLSSADHNTGVGIAAMDAITSGDRNTALGHQALSGLTGGGDNTAIGKDALLANNNHGSVAIGAYAAHALSNGKGYTVVIGSQWNNNAFDAEKAVAIGRTALSNTTADYTVGIGSSAGYGITSGSGNIAIGKDAGYNVGTGARNIAIGYQAMDGASNDSDNIAIGYDALGGAVNGGEKNLAIGNYTLDALTSGDQNVALGYNAGGGITEGHSNVAIGHDALTATLIYGENVAIGQNALKQLTGNSYANTAIGRMSSTVMTYGEENTTIGYYSGAALANGAHRNILIGSYAGDNITTGDNNVVIGKADVTATGSDQLSISSGDGSPVWITGGSDGFVNFPASKIKLNDSYGSDGQVLTSTGSGVAWEAVSGGIASLAADSTPQLGGNLDVDGNDIVSTSNGPIDINPHGTGKVRINTTSTDGLKFDVRGNSNETVANFRISTTSTTSNAFAALQLISGTTGTSGTGQGARLQFRTGNDGYAGYTAGAIYSSRVDDSNHHLHIAPQGTGNVSLGNFTFNADQSVGSGQDNYVLTYDHSAETIGLEAAGGGGASALDDLSDAKTFATDNIGIGENTMSAENTGAQYNYAFGKGALQDLTTGDRNNAFGLYALGDITTTSYNVAMGDFAARNATGTGNTAIGRDAGRNITTGSYNTYLGYQAGSPNGAQSGTGDHNIGIGRLAAREMRSGTRNIAIGAYALDAADTESDNIAIGYDALGGAVAGGEKNLAIGNYTLDALTSGEKNIAIGHNSGTGLTTGSNNIAIGYAVLDAATTESHNIGIGYAALGGASLSGGINNMALGSYTLDGLTSGDNNLAVGYDAGGSISTGSHNTTLGYQSGRLIQAGDKNITLGWTAGNNITSGDNNVVIGAADVASATGDDQLSISSGDGSPVWITGTSAGAVNLPNSILTIAGSVGSDGQVLTSTGSAVAWEDAGGGGASALSGLSDVLIDATNWTNGFLIQPDSDGSAPTTGTLNGASNNVGIGSDALMQITSGDHNIVFGMEAGRGITSGQRNISIGGNSNWTGGTQSYNVAVGYNSMSGAQNGADNNVAVGYAALAGSLTADEIVAVGNYAGTAHTSGSEAVYIGGDAGRANTTGSRNIAIGYQAYDGADTESDNIAIGHSALGGAVAGGEKNIAIGNYAGDAVTSGDESVLLGYRAGSAQTTGTKMVAIGADALYQGTAQNFMTAVGHSAGYSQTGTEGVLIGSDAGYNGGASHGAVHVGRQAGYNATGNDNVSVGRFAMFSASSSNTGEKNVAIGRAALYGLSSGHRNIAIGYAALDNADTESDNIAIGHDALGGAVAGGEKNVVIGNYAGDALTSADGSVMVGHQSGTAVSSGGLNTLVGYQTGSQVSTGIGNTMLGYQAGGYGNHQYSIGIGYGAMQSADNTGDHNIAIGSWAMQNGALTGDYNVGLGYKAGYNLGAAAHKNITIGHQSGDNITTGDFNVIIGGGDAASATGDSQLLISSGDGGVSWITGTSAGVVNIPGSLTVAGSAVGGASDLDGLSDAKKSGTNFTDSLLIGHQSTGTLSNAIFNVAVGTTAMTSITSAANNTAVGSYAGQLTSSGQNNTYIGYKAGRYLTTDNYNTVLGYSALGSNNTRTGETAYNVVIGAFAADAVTTANNLVAVGYGALGSNTSGHTNTAIGQNAQTANLTGLYNTSLGYDTLKGNTTGSRNIAIGHKALDAPDTESDNIAIGYDALGGAVAGGEKNIAIGNYTLDALTSSDQTVAIGHEAGSAITTGSWNTAVGDSSMKSVNTGYKNTALGYQSLKATTGSSNTAVGSEAIRGSGTGPQNTAVGAQAGYAMTDGSNNTFLGFQAGNNITTGHNNVVIGMADVSATGSDQLSISSGDGSPVWIQGDQYGKVVGNLVPLTYTRGDLDTNAYDFRVPTESGSSATPNAYPMPFAGKVLYASFQFSGGSISGTDANVIRVRRNGGSSGSDIEDVTMTIGDGAWRNTQGTSYTWHSRFDFDFDAGDILQVKRQSGSTDLNKGVATLWVQYRW